MGKIILKCKGRKYRLESLFDSYVCGAYDLTTCKFSFMGSRSFVVSTKTIINPYTHN